MAYFILVVNSIIVLVNICVSYQFCFDMFAKILFFIYLFFLFFIVADGSPLVQLKSPSLTSAVVNCDEDGDL